jgi:hydroxymethylglutaryl-CoA lyase
MEAGVSSLDASFGGVGGCPFAPNATGNIATEDLIYMLSRAGVRTNVSLDKAIETAAWLERQLGKTVPGMVMKAGGFPGKDSVA